MPAKKGRAWKMERAHVKNSRRGNNKYSSSDAQSKPPVPGTRQRFWVGGHTRNDGTYVNGHYRTNPNYKE